MLTFLSIAWMGAKMMQVEVCVLQFVKTVNGEPTLAISNQGALNVDLQWQSGIWILTLEVEVQPPLVEFEWGAVEFEWGAGKVEEEKMWRVVEDIMGYEIFSKGLNNKFA